MEPLTLKTAVRFNRVTPMFINDPIVVEAIGKIAKNPAVINEADELKKVVTNLSEIKYVNLELQKRFGYSNNLKLMMANETIFNALLNNCLKEKLQGNVKLRFLDLEDFDYINVNLREAAKIYNKELIRNYADLVLQNKGKAYKEEIQNIPALQKENQELKVKVEQLEKDLAAANTKVQQLEKDLTAANTKIKEMKTDLVAANAKVQELTKALAAANAEIERLKEIEQKWKRVVAIFNSGQVPTEIIKELKRILNGESVSAK